MARLQYGDSHLRVTMDDTLDRLFRAALEDLAPGLVPEMERSAEAVYSSAHEAWPVKTGRSKAALGRSVFVTDKSTVRASVFNSIDYAKFVKPKSIGGESAFVELLRKPLQKEATRLIGALGPAAKAALTGGRRG